MYQHISQQAQIAYSSNFEALIAAQHYLTGPDSMAIQPLPLLAYLADRVPGMYLGTSIFLLPLHQPVEVAEQTAMLDIISGGRFLFGVGQALLQNERIGVAMCLDASIPVAISGSNGVCRKKLS